MEASRERGGLLLAEARPLLRIDVNKTRWAWHGSADIRKRKKILENKKKKRLVQTNIDCRVKRTAHRCSAPLRVEDHF